MNCRARRLGPSLLILAMCYCTLARGTSIEELQASGHLHINSALTPNEGIVPGQRVRLTLEIATDTWFTGGTRISIPEVPGLVILQTDQFASNASEVRNGQTWVIQRWTLDVFPQRSGDFTIEPIPLQLQVRTSDADMKGELHSPQLKFSVSVPASLAEAEQWVAAPTFTVSQSFDKPLDDLAVGDAFEHEVVFEASDVLAMMLPTYVVKQQTGLAAYPSPPELDNSVNRGQAQARRRVKVSYVAEQSGAYLLPARDYYWWNTQNLKLELLTLPEMRINVSGTGVTSKTSSVMSTISPRLLLLFSVSLALLAVALRLAYIYLPRLPSARGSTQLSVLARRWRALRKPALATQLNPGSSAEG
jgi:hypothetical protein